jgi:hypothetical protein
VIEPADLCGAVYPNAASRSAISDKMSRAITLPRIRIESGRDQAIRENEEVSFLLC